MTLSHKPRISVDMDQERPESPKSFFVQLKWSKDTWNILMPVTGTLGELKEKIQDNSDVFGLSVNKQELMFNGNRLLEDEILLKDFGITSDSTTSVHLYEKLLIRVKNTDGIVQDFFVNDGMTVADLKKTVGDYFDHFNIHSAVLQLEDGQYLEDEQLTLKAANIGTNSSRLIYTFRC